jgi:hypothetical protein
MESAVKVTVVYHISHIKTKKQAAGERMHTEVILIFIGYRQPGYFCVGLLRAADSALKHRCNGLKIKAFKGILRVIFFTATLLGVYFAVRKTNVTVMRP